MGRFAAGGREKEEVEEADAVQEQNCGAAHDARMSHGGGERGRGKLA